MTKGTSTRGKHKEPREDKNDFTLSGSRYLPCSEPKMRDDRSDQICQINSVHREPAWTSPSIPVESTFAGPASVEVVTRTA